MNKSRNRLGEKDMTSSGQNVGLSPTFSTISKKKKLSLWNQLRKTDRQISKLVGYYDTIQKAMKSDWMHLYNPDKIDKLIKLDIKRKNIRNKLKGYATRN